FNSTHKVVLPQSYPYDLIDGAILSHCESCWIAQTVQIEPDLKLAANLMVFIIRICIFFFRSRKPRYMTAIAARAITIFFPDALAVSSNEHIQDFIHHRVIFLINYIPLCYFLLLFAVRF